MRWRYGIVRYRNKLKPEHRFYGVGELYYDKDPLAPHSCTEEPVESYADAEEEDTEDAVKDGLKLDLERMLRDCMKYPIFDIDGPYEKAPWDGKRDLDSLTIEQLQTMSDEDIENWLEAEKQ
jgi:hypothetical protein